jgi:hypothetical protein
VAVPAPETWLSDLHRHYTMDDQRHDAATSAAGPAARPAPAAAETVFF